MNEERIRRTNETGSSGSIYFQHTPAHKNIYEKVYTDGVFPRLQQDIAAAQPGKE